MGSIDHLTFTGHQYCPRSTFYPILIKPAYKNTFKSRQSVHLLNLTTASTFAKPITNRSSGFYNACFVAVRIALCIYLYVCVVVQSHANKIK